MLLSFLGESNFWNFSSGSILNGVYSSPLPWFLENISFVKRLCLSRPRRR